MSFAGGRSREVTLLKAFEDRGRDVLSQGFAIPGGWMTLNKSRSTTTLGHIGRIQMEQSVRLEALLQSIRREPTARYLGEAPSTFSANFRIGNDSYPRRHLEEMSPLLEREKIDRYRAEQDSKFSPMYYHQSDLKPAY